MPHNNPFTDLIDQEKAKLENTVNPINPENTVIPVKEEIPSSANSSESDQEPPKSPLSGGLSNDLKKVEDKPKKKKSAWLLLGALFITLILMVVVLVFALAMGGANNPILQTFNIDPFSLKESLIFLTNAAFGAISFILFLLLVFGIFKGLMTKKEESDKKRNSLVLTLFSFGMMFVTMAVWLGVFNFISNFVVNAEAAPAEIQVLNELGQKMTAKEILALPTPLELTLSAEQAKTAWERKRKQVTDYAWDFNNDRNFEFKTQELTFVREFNSSGETTIRLMLMFSDGTQEIIEKTLVFPNAVFDYSPKLGSAPLDVHFNASLFNDPRNPITEYAWDFNGDAEFDLVTDKSETDYTFKKIGTYQVVLRTKSIAGLIKKYTAEIEVLGGVGALENLKAVINVSPKEEGLVPLSLRFSAEDSVSPNGNIVSYRWNFNDETFEARGQTVDHTFNTAGEFNVVLTVMDETGEKIESTKTITVNANKSAPKALIKSVPEILKGEAPFTVEFDASSSEDEDRNIIDYAWDFESDNKVDAQGEQVSFVFRNAGTYTVLLKVTDADGNVSSETKEVVVVGAVLTALISANPESGSVPLTVEFDASQSIAPNGQIISYEWDFGDGELPQLAGAQKMHRYTRVGVYEVSLKVFDDNGKEAKTTQKIYVRVAPTQSCFTVSRHDGVAPLGVSFDSACSLGNITTWKWDFGDSSISRERKPVHEFVNSGRYIVSLEIIDATNNVSRYSDVIEVQ